MKVQFSTIRFLTSLCTGFLLFLAPAYAQPQPEDGNEGSLIDFSIKEAFLNFSYLGNKPAPSMGPKRAPRADRGYRLHPKGIRQPHPYR
jgi:hypothetical protein